jgi:hypothetical protein
MRFRPVGGADVTLLTVDFDGPDGALEAIARALDERRSLIFVHARYNREVAKMVWSPTLPMWFPCGCRGKTAKRPASTCSGWFDRAGAADHTADSPGSGRR